MVPRLNTAHRRVTHPPDLADTLHSWLPLRPKPEQTPTTERLTRHIDRTFGTALHLLKNEPLHFLAFMDASCDAAQHRLWKYYEPAAFDTTLWDLDTTPADTLDQRGQVIPAVYRHLDRRLGELLAELDQDTLLIVLSDHGQGPAPRPRVHLRMDRLLADLGWAQPASDPRPRHPLDLSKSRAYPLVETPWTPTLRVNLNQRGREAAGIVPPAKAKGLRQQLADDLAAVHFEGGDPLFGDIKVRTARRGTDLRLPLAPGVRDPHRVGRTLLLGDRKVPLSRYLDIDTTISGEHDAQGVIFLHGPGVRPGYLGQRTVTTAFHELLWHLTDKIDAVDRLLPPLRRLGLLDTATTLDLTPTVLHAFGLPVARDMEGRPLLEAHRTPQPVQFIETWELGDTPEATPDPEQEEEGEDEELMERLRSLGYVN